eukprot:g1640.t1
MSNKAINDIFGDSSGSDSDGDEQDLFKGLGGGGSDDDSSSSSSDDSSSDEEVSRPPKKKIKRTVSKKKPPTNKDPTSVGGGLTKNKKGDSGDEYDSGEEVEETQADRDFLDLEDDDQALVNSYKGKQKFDDRRPDNYKRKKKTRREPRDAVEAAIMKNRKPTYKTEKTAQEIENDVDKFLSKMIMAAKDDYEAVQNNQQAIHKLKMLNAVDKQLRKKKLFETFLKKNVLHVLNQWLLPYHDYSLPNVSVRTVILSLLWPITNKAVLNRNNNFENDLKDSEGLGKTISMYCEMPTETKKNKKRAHIIKEKWMRSVFKKTDNYADLKAMNKQYIRRNKVAPPQFMMATGGDAANLIDDEILRQAGAKPRDALTKINANDQLTEDDLDELIPGRRRSTIPRQLPFGYQANVKSKRVQDDSEDIEGDQARKRNAELKNNITKKLLKRRKDASANIPRRAVKMSIEGRGMRK